MPKIKI